jgi:aminoglycoside 6'-N-acetyltransferase I
MSVPPFDVRRAIPSDCDDLSRMYEALWPEASAAEYATEIAPVLAGTPRGTLPLAIFVAEAGDGALAGFLEAGLRSHADGCDPRQPVGFLEGWFVAERYRRQGAGAALLRAAEEWARGQGCMEMASDTWIDSEDSQRVHESLEFEVVDRCVHYRKSL